MAAQEYKFEYFNVSFPVEYVAYVEINRPEKLNAFIEIMWLNLRKIFEQLSSDSNVRAIVVSGAGDKAFTAGLDVQTASQGILTPSNEDGARKATKLRRHILEFQECITAVEKCEKPVIALLHGYSYGLAIDLSSACDIRLCASNTNFSVKEVDIGLAADIGTLSRLPKIVRSASWVKDICLSARIWNAEEALWQGFVSLVLESKEELMQVGVEMAKAIAAKSPVAVQGTKALLDYSRDHSVEEGLKMTAVWNAGMLQTKDVQNAMLSGLQKRKPTFEKL